MENNRGWWVGLIVFLAVFGGIIYGIKHSSITTTNLQTRLGEQTVPLYPIRHNNLWGYMDENGKVKIQPVYENALEFHEGVAQVQKNGRWGFIDSSGKMIIPARFDRVDRFYEGLSRVAENLSDTEYSGFIDKSGKLTMNIDGVTYFGYFSEGVASFQKNGKFGFTDPTGKMVIPLQFDLAGNFSEGLAGVAFKSGDDYKWGYIDHSGSIKIPIQFDDISRFSEGLASVRLGNQYGFINQEGTLVIPPQYEYTGDFSEGLAPVFNTHFGFIDRTGKMIIAQQFAFAGGFKEGLAPVSNEAGENSVWGYIDRTGKFVIQPQYDSPGAFSANMSFVGGLAQVTVGEEFGYIDKAGKYVWQPCSSCNIQK